MERFPVQELADGLLALLRRGPTDGMDAGELRPLLQATRARAVGYWKHDSGVLELAGFLAVDDMPRDVQQEFVAATQSVALTQTQFGIVQAAVSGLPSLNHRAAAGADPGTGSIGWLGRFSAASSIAVPVFRGDVLQGTLAVAAGLRIEPEDDVWRCVVRTASALGKKIRIFHETGDFSPTNP